MNFSDESYDFWTNMTWESAECISAKKIHTVLVDVKVVTILIKKNGVTV